jgi:hypothetical protein
VYLADGKLAVAGKPSLRTHAEPLFEHRAAVTAALMGESDEWYSATTWTQVVESPRAPEVPPWPWEAAMLALTLTPDDLPGVPFEFGGLHCVVTDRARFLSWLQADVLLGPAGPRARYGALQIDVIRLSDITKTGA